MVVQIISLIQIIMGHLESIEQELRELLTHAEPEAVVSWVKERVLQSYKNGLARGGRKGDGVSRKAAGSGISK